MNPEPTAPFLGNPPPKSSLAMFSHIPAQPYTKNKLNEPPRVNVPPPTLEYTNGQPSFTVRNAAASHHGSLDYGSLEFGNPHFLQALVRNGDIIRVSHQMLEWKYEMRRTATEILPFLLLGPSTAARDEEFVKGQGITFLIAVRNGFTARAISNLLDPTRFASSKGIQTLTVDLDSSYDLITKLPQTIKAMNDHLENTCTQIPPLSIEQVKGKVLVFCESGNERSATVVAAYIMVVYGLSAVKAIQMIQSQRFCIAIEEAMKNMLSDFEEILKAKKDVARAFGAGGHAEQQLAYQATLNAGNVVGARARKRNLERVYDSDEDMEDQTIDGEGRSNWVPFHDTAN